MPRCLGYASRPALDRGCNYTWKLHLRLIARRLVALDKDQRHVPKPGVAGLDSDFADALAGDREVEPIRHPAPLPFLDPDVL